MLHEVQADSNTKTLKARTGDVIAIRLEETPTSGYMWVVDEVSGDSCQQGSSDYQLDPEAAIGGGGIRTLTFQVNKVGNCRIRLKNWQRWTGDIYKKFELGVTVE